MTLASIRKEIFETVRKIEDETALLRLMEYLKQTEIESKILYLNSWQKKQIREAKREIEQGRGISEQEANKRTQAWFRSKEK